MADEIPAGHPDHPAFSWSLPNYPLVILRDRLLPSPIDGSLAAFPVPKRPANWPPPGWQNNREPLDPSAEAALQWLKSMEEHFRELHELNVDFGEPEANRHSTVIDDAHLLKQHFQDHHGWNDAPPHPSCNMVALRAADELRNIREWFERNARSDKVAEPRPYTRAEQIDAKVASDPVLPPSATKTARESSPGVRGPQVATEAAAFSGGTMAFLADRVELCGVRICCTKRSRNARRALDLLRMKNNGSFVSYSGEELAESLGLRGGQNGAAGLIRDLRDMIQSALRDEANIDSGTEDVILSRGPGYRLKEWITVQEGNSGEDQGHHESTDDPDRETNHDPDRDPDDPNGAPARRRWILAQLADDRPLRAPDVVDQFGCSLSTAKRDLQALKDAGKIGFDGTPRTGFYRLKKLRSHADD